MRINPSVMASAINRYEKAIRQQRVGTSPEQINDKVEISGNAKIYNKLMQKSLEDSGDDSEKIHSIINRISAGTYKVDVDNIIESMLRSR